MHDEEDIDTEALQAQIDLAMSVTNDLVSSWIKPSNKPKTTYNQTLEAELNEHMRRPPRLGVGASIPESTSVSSRETARLKGSLVGKGKKRAREEERDTAHKSASDDEGESRAGAIRKKPAPNPFTLQTAKKPPQGEGGLNTAGPASVKTINKNGEDRKTRSSTSPMSGIEGDQRPKHDTREDSPVRAAATVPGNKTIDGAQSSSRLSTPPAPIPPPSPSSPEKSQRHPHSPKITRDVIHTVLNLNGPVEGPKADADLNEADASSPKSKKRRKRRKKKRAQVTGGLVEESKHTTDGVRREDEDSS
ncbi:hypothetical protein FB446DRAFT_840406 [Lentinula raphanica]|nr:hypothetical protein FB446DRAFT_840406 [Lentinula raphanica]